MTPKWLEDLQAQLEEKSCDEALSWMSAYSSLQDAWNDCRRPDWMLHYLGRFIGRQGSPEHRKFVRTTVACARLSLPFAGAFRAKLEPIYAQLDRWVVGEDVDLNALTTAAYYSTWAARHSAWAAYYSTWAAYYSAWAARTSAWAARDSSNAARKSSEAVRDSTSVTMCAIIREAYPTPPEPAS